MPTKNKAISETTMESIASKSASEVPTVQCAVNRRANLGNYEHLDILGSLEVPVGCDMDEWREQISITFSEVFREVSREVNERYQMIKEAQGGGRPEGTN